MTHKKIYLIAGEASGDLHGSNLMKALKLESEHELDFRFWGGDQMKAQGGTLVKHIKELAFMGFVEVLMNIRTIFKNIKLCKQDIEQFNPDVLVLIDYPGFNLRIASWAKSKGIKVVYYISPQIWAWKESRIHKIKASVDQMNVILPFEKDFYAKHQMKVEFVGHPLKEVIQQYKSKRKSINELKAEFNVGEKVITLLPGSRKQEVSKLLPIMLESIKQFPDYEILIAQAPTLEDDFFEEYVSDKVKLIPSRTYDLLSIADLALVTSGTATLETALLGIPQVVCYVGSNLSYQIAKRLVKIKYISLVNLIMDKVVVTELIQNECNESRIYQEINKILPGQISRQNMLQSYTELQELLGNEDASQKVAQNLLKLI